MTSVQSLDSWNEEYGDEDFTTPDKRRDRFMLKVGMCYPVTIKVATLTISQLGEVQIALDMDVRDGSNDEVVAQTKDWVSLPMQPKTDMSKEKKTVVTLTRIRRNVLSTILASVDPHRFAPGKPADLDGQRRTLSWQSGRELTQDEFNDRQIQCNREVLAYATELHGMLEETDGQDVKLEGWPGTELYLSKKENDRNPKYPYSRYHTEPGFGLPLFAQGGSNAAPF